MEYMWQIILGALVIYGFQKLLSGVLSKDNDGQTAVEHLDNMGRLMAMAYEVDEKMLIPRWTELRYKGIPTLIVDDGGHLTVATTDDKACFQLIELIEPEHTETFHQSALKQAEELKERYGEGIYSCFTVVCDADKPILGLDYYKYQININIPKLKEEDIIQILQMQRQLTREHSFPSAVREVKANYYDQLYEIKYKSCSATEIWEIKENGERKPLAIGPKGIQTLMFLDELVTSENVTLCQ